MAWRCSWPRDWTQARAVTLPNPKQLGHQGTPGFVFVFCFLGLHLWHMEVPRLGAESELHLLAYTTATAMRDSSCICSQQRQILKPLNEARDWTWILMDTSWVCNGWATMGTPVFWGFFCLFVCFYFLGPHLWPMEVPRLGVKLELQLPQPQQCGIQMESVTYTTAHSNAESLTHWTRPGIEPASSWILVVFVTSEPQWELPGFCF